MVFYGFELNEFYSENQFSITSTQFLKIIIFGSIYDEFSQKSHIIWTIVHSIFEPNFDKMSYFTGFDPKPIFKFINSYCSFIVFDKNLWWSYFLSNRKIRINVLVITRLIREHGHRLLLSLITS